MQNRAQAMEQPHHTNSSTSKIPSTYKVPSKRTTWSLYFHHSVVHASSKCSRMQGGCSLALALSGPQRTTPPRYGADISEVLAVGQFGLREGNRPALTKPHSTRRRVHGPQTSGTDLKRPGFQVDMFEGFSRDSCQVTWEPLARAATTSRALRAVSNSVGS